MKLMKFSADMIFNRLKPCYRWPRSEIRYKFEKMGVKEITVLDVLTARKPRNISYDDWMWLANSMLSYQLYFGGFNKLNPVERVIEDIDISKLPKRVEREMLYTYVKFHLWGE